MGPEGSVYEGKTLEQAIGKGLEALGLSRAEVMIQVVEEGSGGFLGLGARPYRVRVKPRPGGAPHEPDDRSRRDGRGRRDRHERGGRGRRDERPATVSAEGERRGRRDRDARRRDERPAVARRDDRPRRDEARPSEERPSRRDEVRRPEGRPDEPRRDEGRRDEFRRDEGRRPERLEPERRDRGGEPEREPMPAMAGEPRAREEGGDDESERRRRRRGRRGGRRRREERGLPVGAAGESQPVESRVPDDSPREDFEGSSEFEMSGHRPASATAIGEPPDSAGEMMAPADLAVLGKRATEELFKAMGFEARVEATAEADQVNVTAEVQEQEDLLTGPKGEVRQALQHLLNLTINRGHGARYHLQLEINDFWKQREDELKAIALKLAEEALSSQNEAVTEYLNAQERRIVHMTLKEDPRVKTYALGSGLIKRVAVAPADFPEAPRDED